MQDVGKCELVIFLLVFGLSCIFTVIGCLEFDSQAPETITCLSLSSSEISCLVFTSLAGTD